MDNIPSIFLTHEPSVWALPPERMSFSKLRQIESCPRRWSLLMSDYPLIWDKHGYPEPINTMNIYGRVTHRVLEIIIKELDKQGKTSLDDSKLITAMRDLGGFSYVIEKNIIEILTPFKNNPRANERIEEIKNQLNNLTEEIRENVRVLLSRMFNNHHNNILKSSNNYDGNKQIEYGIHSEVRLINEEIKWEGIADVIRLTPDICEIRDFKTGMPKEDHVEQLQIYSLLWLFDVKNNPKKRQASKLTLSYINGDIDVPLIPDLNISAFYEKLIYRTKTVRETLTRKPPDAKPNQDYCPYCTVRHLCGKYWEETTQKQLSLIKQKNTIFDIEVEIIGTHGSKSYDVIPITSRFFPKNTQLVFRFSKSMQVFKKLDRIRLLGVTIEQDNEDSIYKIINSTKATEYYFVNRNES